MKNKYDAVVVGSGPNGLAAAIRLAQDRLSVLLIEGKETIGGGMRSAELTLPGFIHDICSAIHPLAFASPFFASLPLQQYGLEWVHSPAPLAHPLKKGSTIVLERSIERTCDYLGKDGAAYQRLMKPLVSTWNDLAADILGPLHFPRHPMTLARFAYYGFQSIEGLAQRIFQEKEARALLGGLAAHAILPLNKWATASFGLVLGILGHCVGWPFPRGGTQQLADALASHFRSLGGEIRTGMLVETLEQIPEARIVLLDVTPKQLLSIAGDHLPEGYQRRLKRYRYGPGVFKIDWALNAPIPWKNSACSRAATVHLGGTLDDIACSEQLVWDGKIPENHFILLAQPSLFDASRAPAGKHTAWAYCHVPSESDADFTRSIEKEIEQYAPGFQNCIIGRHTKSAKDLEVYNPNYVGGDINGGVADLFQLFTRPLMRMVPYSTPLKYLYICSSSTPPGGGVHGMCGFHAAEAALLANF